MKILFVTPRIPYPPDTGAKIRTFNLLKQARAGGNKVILLSFAYEEEDKAYAKTIEKLGVEVITVKGKDNINFFTALKALLKGLPLTIAKYNSRKMALRLNRLIAKNDIDVVHLDHLHLGQYVAYCNGTPAIIDEHNVESVLLRRIYEKETDPLKKLIMERECRKMKRTEKKNCLKASKVLVTSKKDKIALERLCMDGLSPEVVPNGVDTEHFKSIVRASTLLRTGSPESIENSLVFTGSMDWLPNSDAVEYFCKEILPLIRQVKKEVKFYIVGRGPTKKINELSKKDKRIIVTGKVEDVRPYIERAGVFVVPIRIGGGTRLKVLEAMSMQKAVVSTSLGAEGIDYADGTNIMLADRPQTFADKVISLLDDDNRAAEVGLNGRKLVCSKYDWSIIGKKLNKMYSEVVKC